MILRYHSCACFTILLCSTLKDESSSKRCIYTKWFYLFFGTYIGLELFQYMSGNLLIPLAKAWGGTLFWTECTSTVLVNKRLDCTKNAVIVKTIGWRPKRHMVDVAGLCKVCLDGPLMKNTEKRSSYTHSFLFEITYSYTLKDSLHYSYQIRIFITQISNFRWNSKIKEVVFYLSN